MKLHPKRDVSYTIKMTLSVAGASFRAPMLSSDTSKTWWNLIFLKAHETSTSVAALESSDPLYFTFIMLSISIGLMS